MPNGKHGAVVLLLLCAEAAAGLRTLRYRDMAWIGLGGGGLLLYGAISVAGRLRLAAPLLRHAPLQGAGAAAVVALLIGLLCGLAAGRLTLARALRPFLLVQPLRHTELVHSAALAAAAVGMAIALISGALLVPAVAPAGIVVALLLAGSWTSSFLAAFAVGAVLHLRSSHDEADQSAVPGPGAPAGMHLALLETLDRGAPRWLGSWAWGTAPGRVRLTAIQAIALAIIVTGTVFASGAGLSQHEGGPATLAALVGGLLVFMLSLSCRPLGSPVLRTAPVGFLKAWLWLLRLPLLFSLAFFVLPAGAALAAEPAGWTLPAQAGLGLVLLNGLYAVFAACFLTSPLAASLCFLGALGYFSWQSVDLGRSVYFGLAVLIAWLWHRARRRYRHG